MDGCLEGLNQLPFLIDTQSLVRLKSHWSKVSSARFEMPHPIRTEEEMARGPFEVSDFPDKIADTTVAFAMCKAVPEIVDGEKRQ